MNTCLSLCTDGVFTTVFAIEGKALRGREYLESENRLYQIYARVMWEIRVIAVQEDAELRIQDSPISAYRAEDEATLATLRSLY